jgi:cytosine/adenosine deaminase-related metal-dependent hydrolase
VQDRFSDRVRPGISPHAPYSVSLDLYRACAELHLPVATHLSESRAEIKYLLRGEGPWGGYSDLLVDPPGTTGVRLLAENDLLGSHVVAAHCVMVDEEEIGLLASTGTGIAHCPRSNAALGCGIAPLAELRAAHCRVGVGTDSPASAPSFDFFEELRSVALSARAKAGRPDVLSASQALELGTLGSAKALGLDGEIGSLVAGKRADVAVVSLAGSPYLPWEDPAGAVVFGGSPDRVIATYVDGEARYEKGGMDWQELTAAAHSARRAMLAAPPAARPVAAAPRA